VPGLPTLAESGFPGYEAVPWFGLMAPAGTPQAIIDRLHAEAVKALAFPDARAALVNQGLDVIGGTPAEFAAVIRTETPYWARSSRRQASRLSEGRRACCEQTPFLMVRSRAPARRLEPWPEATAVHAAILRDARCARSSG
jgi:hypothetical protein